MASKQLLANWGFLRIVHVLVGLYFVIGAFFTSDVFGAMLGIMLLVQAWFNMGCLLGGGCAAPASRKGSNLNKTSENDDIDYTPLN